ncbi:MAG: HAMP domain-containing protein [Deltaproteobacteria bacterium]|nr:HAMP domain-containing protein [Deltaproteobacteria bacterium]
MSVPLRKPLKWRLFQIWAFLDGSVRARILIPTIALFALTLVAVGFTALELYDLKLQEARSRSMLSSVQVLVSGYASAKLGGGPKPQAEPMLKLALDQNPDVEAVRLLRADGGLASGHSGDSDLGGRAIASIEPGIPFQVGDGREAIVWPLLNGPSCSGCHGKDASVLGWIHVRFAPAAHEAERRHLVGSLLRAGAPGLLLLVLIALWLLNREAVAPLKRLISVMKRAEAGETELSADEGLPDELGEAARSFDRMLTALRATQAELEAVYGDHMIRANRFAGVGELAAHMAHEIRNPLAGLSGVLELLGEDLADTPKGPLIGEMRHQVDRLTRTMESLLSYARPTKPQLQRTFVGTAIDRALFLVAQNQRRSNRIELHKDLEADLPAVLADPPLLEQVLLNLCLNAVQAMTEGGQLTVRAYSPREDRVIIEVTDSGPGIPLPARGSLFKPFFTTKRNGNGLGLAISARIMKEHGGELSFECPDSGGCVFRISLRTFASDTLAEEAAA